MYFTGSGVSVKGVVEKELAVMGDGQQNKKNGKITVVGTHCRVEG